MNKLLLLLLALTFSTSSYAGSDYLGDNLETPALTGRVMELTGCNTYTGKTSLRYVAKSMVVYLYTYTPSPSPSRKGLCDGLKVLTGIVLLGGGSTSMSFYVTETPEQIIKFINE